MKAILLILVLSALCFTAITAQNPNYFLGDQGDDCYTTCLNNNMNCIPHVSTGNDTSLFTQLGVNNCTPDYAPWWANDQPSYCSDPSDENYGKCVGFINVPSALFCGGSFPTTRRICACSKPDSSATFGWGFSNGPITDAETVMFTRVLQNGDTGVMTHFWVTEPGYPYDNTISIKYYIDGELNASIAFQPALACGTGFDSQTAPWGNNWFGKGSQEGGWSWNFRVPFQRSIKITASMSNPLPDGGFYMIVRGGTNIPVVIGDMILPSETVLQQFTTDQVFDPLDWVTLANVPSGPGLFFMHTISVISGTMNFLEGCYHMYTAETPDFPGVLLSTGTEDYFDSAWYFSAGEFRLPVSGFTFFNSTSDTIFWSAYRFHDMDPLQFNNGMQFVWRNGDADTVTGMKCLSNTGEGITVGEPTDSQVTAYAWVYTWPESSKIRYRF